MALWLSAASIASVHAQTHFKTDAVSPSNALQVIEDANGYVGVGTTGLSSTSLPTDVVFATGNLSYSSTSVPSAIMAVINKASAPLPSPGNSGISFAVIRTDGSPTNDPTVDCVIDNMGAVGFGTTPDQFFPAGTHFGIVDNDNTSTLPLFNTYTN